MTAHIIELCVLLLLSAFFSGSETAFFSLGGMTLRKMRESKSLRERIAYDVATRPRRLLFSVLLGNMVVNILFFATSFELSRRIVAGRGAGYSVLAGVAALAVVIIFGEVTPKTVAVHMPFQLAKFAAIPLLLMQKAFAPVEWLAARLKKRRAAEPHGERARGVLLPDELKEMLSMSGFAPDVDARLRGLLKEIIDFSEVEVHEVMVPRVDMVSCRADAPLDELIEIIKKKKIKHVPVYGANRDEILGTVNAKEVFAGRANDVRSLVKPVMFVPETKKVESLLADFRQEKQTFAVVVNEYGGTEGIVTLEDVVEEIVGEIEDEFDRVRPRITRLSARKWLVDAGYSLRDFCERFGLSADQGLADTVGGFVAALLGEVPLVGAEVRYGPLKMTLREVRKYRPVVILVEVMKEMEE